MAGNKTTWIMLGTTCTARVVETTCTARVVEKSPVIHYLLPTNDVVHISSANYQAYICWQILVAQQEQLDTIIMTGCTMAKKIVSPLS